MNSNPNLGDQADNKPDPVAKSTERGWHDCVPGGSSDTFFDVLAESFEKSWKVRKPARIHEWLLEVAPGNQLRLAERLLPIELEYRTRLGQSIDPTIDYGELGSEVVQLVFACLEELRLESEAGQFSSDPIPKVKPGQSTLNTALEQAQQPTLFEFGSGASAPALVGPYRMVKQIGKGGMGEVWLAEQDQPVRRRVAIKLIKQEIVSPDLRARFDLERQSLAMMNHPNIARIIEAGATRENHPWFAMEFVEGKPLNEHCDQQQLSLTQRLELFRQVLAGVQHAHQKGILHRDLKPSNILVRQQDRRAVPQIIDFGLAKLLHPDVGLAEADIQTATGHVIGTFKYMSPEQASLNQNDIDTRSDIYSLGTILYELLVGKTPYDQRAIESCTMLDLLRAIREHEPLCPSRMLETLPPADQTTISKSRQLEPAKLASRLRGELDWIVLKALEKDRERRYQSVNELADDLDDYLSGEPVSARPQSIRYRLKKWVRKQRVIVVSGAVALVALIAASVISLVSANRAVESRKLAEQRLEQTTRANELEREARQLADAAAQQAQKRLEQVQQSSQLLADVFADLEIGRVRAGNEPLEAVLATRLKNAAVQMDESLGDPLLVAGLQNQLGAALSALGYASDAVPLCRQSLETRSAILGPDHPNTLQSGHSLGESLSRAGELKLAEAQLLDTLNRRTQVLGADDPATLASMTSLALVAQQLGKLPDALEWFQQVLQRRIALQPDDPVSLAESMSNVAFCLRALGKYSDAFGYFESAHAIHVKELGERHPRTLLTRNNLAYGHIDLNRRDLALPMLEENARLRTEVFGSDHPSTLDARASLASLYRDLGQVERALPIAEDVLIRSRLKLGDKHPDTLYNMNNLARCYRAANRLDKAIPLFEETAELRQEELGNRHPSTLSSINNLALAYVADQQFEKALPLMRETLAVRQETLGADHPGTLVSMNALAGVYRSSGKLEQALPLFEQTLELRRKKLGNESPETINSMVNLAQTYCELDRPLDGIPLLEEAVALATKQSTFNPWERIDSQLILARAYGQVDRVAEAVQLLEATFSDCASADPSRQSAQQQKMGLAIIEQLMEFGQQLGNETELEKWSEEKRRWIDR